MTFLEGLQSSIEVKTRVANDRFLLEVVERIGRELCRVYQSGGKLMVAGNGGSAADAQHIVAEIVCQFLDKNREGRSALSLVSNASVLTAWGNDRSFETVFARQVEAHGVSGDALLLISTSGNSVDLVRAAEVANKKGVLVIGLLGSDGGRLSRLCDHAVVVPSDETPRIQECHIVVYHYWCAVLDTFFAEADKKEAGM